MAGLSNRVRLLAYGGTSFVLRNQVGRWPAIPEGTLQDLTGLFSGRAFGLGCLDGRLFLILRELQNAYDRGGYAYTLLLDPGDLVWQRFQWNAAALALSLLRHPDLSRRFLQDVETCTSGAIESDLALLEPAGTSPADRRVTELLAGAMASDGVWLVPHRMPVETAAASVEALPPPLRGQPFLVGGCRVHAQMFGARVVWDDKISTASPGLDGLAETGRRVIDAWLVLARTRGQRIVPCWEQPIWQWPPEIRRNFQEFAKLSPGAANPESIQRLLTLLPLPRNG